MNEIENFEKEDKPELEFIRSEIQILDEGVKITATEPLIVDIDGNFVKIDEGEEYIVPKGIKQTFAEVYRFKGNKTGLKREYERMLEDRNLVDDENIT